MTTGKAPFHLVQDIEPMDAPVACEGSPINPLIGVLPQDTLNNAAQVLAVLRDNAGMGGYLVLETVRLALIWESRNYHARAGRRRTDGEPG